MDNNLSIAEALPKALFVWLKTLMYFIVLPYKIWKSSLIRVAQTSDSPILQESEEFPMYTFSRVSMDTMIIVMPMIALLVGLLVGMSSYYGGFGLFIGISLGGYFFIPTLSFFKEVITMSLYNVNKLKEIADNTKPKE